MFNFGTYREQVTQALDGIQPQPGEPLTGKLWLGSLLVWSAGEQVVQDTQVAQLKKSQVYEIRFVLSSPDAHPPTITTEDLAFIESLRVAFHSKQDEPLSLAYRTLNGNDAYLMLNLRDVAMIQVRLI